MKWASATNLNCLDDCAPHASQVAPVSRKAALWQNDLPLCRWTSGCSFLESSDAAVDRNARTDDVAREGRDELKFDALCNSIPSGPERSLCRSLHQAEEDEDGAWFVYLRRPGHPGLQTWQQQGDEAAEQQESRAADEAAEELFARGSRDVDTAAAPAPKTGALEDTAADDHKPKNWIEGVFRPNSDGAQAGEGYDAPDAASANPSQQTAVSKGRVESMQPEQGATTSGAQGTLGGGLLGSGVQPVPGTVSPIQRARREPGNEGVVQFRR
eukprot:TRINITY_DN80511_c0_g1_i1.p1 TRINITY_DN80511_c0_g1~~TRINITY_DN80511_c0_g1_i1.p1  ORF type:complete len:270 (+),score=18.15 TRINITY_DN80511_c0_g1_i1:97-906(+)